VDAETGEVLPADTRRKIRPLFGVMSVAFAPSGQRLAVGTADGSVFTWDLKAFRLVGRHDPKVGVPSDGFNRVRLVRFLAEDRLVSAAESTEVVQWDLAASPAPRLREWLIGLRHPVRVATL